VHNDLWIGAAATIAYAHRRVTDTERTDIDNDSSEPARARVIALYLPQFHPIPENDEWWGSGFTEWTNVAKARPLYRGHKQPNLPGELGFYDLRLPESRAAQAALARAHGIEAFCYWHYWFAGERLLERPFAEVLYSGEPDLPFCLAWANQSWTGIWHGAPHRMLKEQTYPGLADYTAHFFSVLPAFQDPRYVQIDGQPLFAVYRPTELPDPTEFTETWRALAKEAGLPGLYLVGFIDDQTWRPADAGFDAAALLSTPSRGIRRGLLDKVGKRVKRIALTAPSTALTLRGRPRVYDYAEVQPAIVFGSSLRDDQYPCVLPNWDNTPRSDRDGSVLHAPTPELFRRHVALAVDLLRDRPIQRRLLFIKSWNEWAEGNYLEPDRRFGRGWLEAVAAEVLGRDA
jgi:hypothetical protein